jgi:hypothetical protein
MYRTQQLVELRPNDGQYRNDRDIRPLSDDQGDVGQISFTKQHQT